MQSPEDRINDKKYTLKQVFDSLYWESVDCDDDYDGYLYVITTIDGTSFKIPLAQALSDYKKEIIGEIKRKLPKIENHICRFNDGTNRCICYEEALSEVKDLLNNL